MRCLRYAWMISAALLVLLRSPASAQTAVAPSSNTPIVHRIRIDNQIINPVTADYITSAIDRAEAARAQCLIIELDTPGGLLESTRAIIKRMMSAEVPIVVYVAPSGARAGSAGVFITLASHIAVMAPTTNIGAAHPVTMDGGGPAKKLIRRFKNDARRELKPTARPATRQKTSETEEVTETDPMSDKILHDTVAWVSGIAKARGRNVDWARRSVEESISVTEQEALESHVIDLVAKNVPELLERLDGRTVQLASGPVTLRTKDAALSTVELGRRRRILLILTNPTVAYLLMMLGFWGLFTEITHPGLAFPGVAGAVCLILALFAFHTLPVNYAGLTLILIGLALFLAEIKIPSYGLLTVGGLTCLTLGSLMLIDSPYAFMRISLRVILPIVLATAGIALFLVSAVARAHARPIVTGAQGMIGEIGIAATALRPAGKVFVHGEVWDATTTQPVAQGGKIRIVQVDRLTLTVEPL